MIRVPWILDTVVDGLKARMEIMAHNGVGRNRGREWSAEERKFGGHVLVVVLAVKDMRGRISRSE
jgi:hypothetical protein